MSSVYHVLAGSDFEQDWSNAGLISTNDDWSDAPSIVGYRTGDVTTATGVDARTVLTDSGFVAQVFANASPTATAGGLHEVETAADPTVAFQGSNGSDFSALVLHLDATGRRDLVLTASIRDLDASQDDAIQQVAVQYRIGDSGAWANVDGGYIGDATTAGSATQVTPLSVALPDAVEGQAQVQLRLLTTNAAGNDELTGVDDIRVTSEPAGGSEPQPGSFLIGDVAAFEGDGDATTAFTFSVSRVGGSEGAVSVDYRVTLPGGTGGAGPDDVRGPLLSGTLAFADGQTSQQLTLDVVADAEVEPNETFTVDLLDPTGGATITDGQATGTILTDDIALSYIHDIQGTAFFSPVLAAEGISSFNTVSAAQVSVSGVVTALDSFGSLRGFYISEEAADWDGDRRTSEGIFVRTSGAVSGLTVGETVTLTAQVMELQDFDNLNRTILVNPTSIAQGNDQVALPTLVLDGSDGRRIPNQITSDDSPDFSDALDDANDGFDPESDGLDFYETLEGMRVTVPDLVVADGFVGGSSDNFVYFNAYSTVHADPRLINSRGGYTIAGDPQFYPVDTAEAGDDAIRGGRHLHDGAVHPDILELDFGNVGRGGTSGFDQLLTMGDRLGDVSGILDFDFGVTKLFVTDALDPTAVAGLGGTPAQETTALDADARSLRIATFNVENLSPVGTVFSSNNGIEITTQAKFDGLAQNIAVNLKAPDILIIEEVQDNNGVDPSGGADATATWEALAAAASAATGKTYSWVDEVPEGNVGGAPGGNIRVGFLYDTARVQLGDLAPDAPIEERRRYTDRIGDGVRTPGDLIAVDDAMLGETIDPTQWEGTRRSIVGEFRFNGQTVYAVGSHLPSKGGSGDLFQIDQNIDAGQPANGDWGLRNALAEDVWAVQNLVSTKTDGLLVSGGDFNEFWFYRPLEVLTGYATPDGQARAGGTRYVNLMVQELPAAERFSYDFDGRSQALDTLLTDAALAEVAEFDAVHINTGYNDRNGAANPATSDHDPSLARFDFRDFAEVLQATGGTLQGFGGDDLLLASPNPDALDGGAGIDTVSYAGSSRGLKADLADSSRNSGAARGDSYSAVENLTGSPYRDVLLGDDNDNRLDGNGSDGAGDSLYGGLGNDTYVVRDPKDHVVERAGEGYDRLVVGPGVASFRLVHGSAVEALRVASADAVDVTGNDLSQYMAGGAGANRLVGGGGNDIVNGWGGDDIVSGGNGLDALIGGAGADVFQIQASRIRAGNLDFLIDFAPGEDRIGLDSATFGLAAGALDPDALYVQGAGGGPFDAEDRILLLTDGRLFFDPDGSGAGAATPFAQLVPGTVLQSTDFFIA